MRRPLLLIGLGVIGLVVLAVAAVLINPNRTADFPADSPEGIVQRYLAASEDGDVPGAYAFFSSGVTSRLDLAEYERRVQFEWQADGRRRVLFDRTTLGGERATVHLTVEVFLGGGPFGGGDTYRYARQVVLVREASGWRIDEPLVGLDPTPL